MFNYDTYTSDSQLERLLDQYARQKRAVTVDFRRLVPSLNSADRATHLLHPYPAKLLMHIPFFFLGNSLLSQPGDTVADPFCGSGTVLLEAILAGRRAVGADSNPLARLLTSVKTSPICVSTLEDVEARLFGRISQRPRGPMPDVVNIEHWFYPHISRQLLCLLEAINCTRNHGVRNYLRVCFSNCVKRVSLSDPRLAVPVKLKAGQYPEGHVLRDKTDSHLRRLRRINVLNVFQAVLQSNRKRLSTIESLEGRASAAVTATDARSFCNSECRPGTVQLIITSPPYPGAQKYIRSSSLSLGWLGLCSSADLLKYKHATIGREEFRFKDYGKYTRTEIPAADRHLSSLHIENPVRAAIASTYLREMRESLASMWDALRPNGFLVLVAANNHIAGREFRTQDYLRIIAEELGFTTELRLVDTIRSRGLMTKRNKTASMITREWVHVFSKRSH